MTMEIAGLVDVHAHLADRSFDADLGVVLERAERAGVVAVVSVSETLADSLRNLELAARYPGKILPAAGVHPVEPDLEQAEKVEALIRQEPGRWAAIGEVGLDFWKAKQGASFEAQRAMFARFIRLSVELDLPLNVHSRSAGRAAIEMLLAGGARRVVLHAFDGRAASALPAVEAGYFFSVPPSAIRSAQKQKLLRRLPLSSLLLETDSPVLGPDREARNEPANLGVSLRAVAEVKELRPEAVAEAVMENTARLFGAILR